MGSNVKAWDLVRLNDNSIPTGTLPIRKVTSGLPIREVSRGGSNCIAECGHFYELTGQCRERLSEYDLFLEDLTLLRLI